MIRPEVVSYLEKCPSPANGCFAADPATFESSVYERDLVTREEYTRISESAMAAGQTGLDLEGARYPAVTIEKVTSVIKDEPDSVYAQGATITELGLGELVPVFDTETKDKATHLRNRIAQCAHTCGATAVGCPLRRQTSPDN